MERERQLWHSQGTSTAYTNGALTKEIVLSLLRKIFPHVFNLTTTGNWATQCFSVCRTRMPVNMLVAYLYTNIPVPKK